MLAPRAETVGARQAERGLWLAGAALLLAYVLLYLLPLGVRPLFSPDEVRYAEVPREMLASGDFVVPRMNGLRYFEKPPLGYWINAAAIAVLGDSAFALRLPGAVATGLTAWLLVGFARRLTGSTAAGLLAAAVHLTCLEVYALATYNLLDPLLTLWLTATIVACHRAGTAGGRREERRFALLAGVAAGAAFLTKGFLALAVPAIVVAPWLLLERRPLALLRITGLAGLTLLAVSAPWSVLMHLREPEFWPYFFLEEHVRRFLAGDDAQHGEPVWFFVMFLPMLAFPWLFLLPAAVAGARVAAGPAERAPGWHLAWWWLLAPFAFFSASSGKLLTYVLPCFPPFAAIVAAGLWSYLSRGRLELARAGLLVVAIVLAGAVVGVALVQAGVVGRPLYGPDTTWRFALLEGAVLACAAIALYAARAADPGRMVPAAVLIAVPLIAVSQFALPDRLYERKAFSSALDGYRDLVTPETVLIANSGTVQAVSWSFRRDDVYVTAPGELQYGLGYPDAAGRLLDEDGFRALVSGAAGRRPILMACKRSCDHDLAAAAGAPVRHRVHGILETWYLPADAKEVESGAHR